jgi:hypothetical protein
MTPCAKDCPKRNATCHSVCPDYKEWRAKKDRENEAKRKEKEIFYALFDNEVNRTKRMKKG